MQNTQPAPDTPRVLATADSRLYAIDRALEPLRWVFRITSLAVLVALVSLPFIQVVAREIFSRPIMGAEELTRFMLICSVFLALPYVVSSGATVRMEELVAMLPERVLRLLKVLASATAIATFSVMAIASFIAIRGNLGNSTPTLGIPYWIFLGAAFASFTMTAIECGVQLLKVLQNRPLYITFPQEAEPPADFEISADKQV
ncbi:TRAP transporter small permease [Arsenicitalea aurantiaca]|uniref:TRAP transporter small permease n=1 Tax=Arsenicitalea aurantiaca TaxID=1783274 RepID=UPI001315492A|nr:TRAP transporter small permease [Arsenicitalea aurantiaca]